MEPTWNAFTGRLENRPALAIRRGVHLAIDTAIAGTAAATAAATAGYLTPRNLTRDRSGRLSAPLKVQEDRSLNNLKRKIDFDMASAKRPRYSRGMRRFTKSSRPAYSTVKSLVESSKVQKRFLTVKAAALTGTVHTAAAAQIRDVTAVTKGDNNDQREGDTIIAKRLSVKCQFNLPAAAGVDSPNCRIIVVQCIADSVLDSYTNNNYLDQTGGAGFISDLYRMKSNNEWFTYKTLFDRTVKITRQISAGQASAFVQCNLRIPAKHQRIFYGGNASDAKVNGIYIINFSESGAVTSQVATRLTFVD